MSSQVPSSDSPACDDGSIFGLYGCGGFGRECIPYLRSLSVRTRYFVETSPSAELIHGIPVVSEGTFLKMGDGCEVGFNVAVGDSGARKMLAERLLARGLSPRDLYCDSAIIHDSANVGPGAIVCSNAMITCDAEVGMFFHLNIYSYVAHDCVIGDFVTFAPRVMCNGGVRIGSGSYIGTGAMIRPGVTVGAGSVVGMGAVVTRDVPDGVTVVGNPAKPLIRN